MRRRENPTIDVQARRLHAIVVHRDGEELLAEDIVEDADRGVQGRGLANLGPRDRNDVAHQHVLQVLGFRGGLAHRKDCRGRGNGIRNADNGFLRNPGALAADHREDRCADEGEQQAHPVHRRRVWVAAGERQQNGNRRPERCNLREGEVDEDNPTFNDVHAQIGMDPGQDQTGDKRRGQEVEDFTYRQPTHGYCVPVCFMVETNRLMS